MKRDYRRVTVLVHGWWGAGKSWFAATAPGPRLVIDAEGGFHDTPGTSVEWRPGEPYPEMDKDTSVIVPVYTWADVHAVMTVLTAEHPFESVIIDSLHELQDLLKQAVAEPGEAYDPNATFEWQAWGRLKNNMGVLCRQLRDMARGGYPTKVNVVLVSGTDDEKIPAKPLLEGGARKVIASFYDIIGYMTMAKDDKGEDVRILQVQPTPAAQAKCRLHNVKVKWDAVIPSPDVKKILAVTNQSPKESK
jgi:hypothetical protein